MNNGYLKYEKFLLSLGMVGVIFYFIHTILGNILWSVYSPITNDISSLTAVGAPNASLLRIFTTIYAICMILFITAMIIKSFKKYNNLVKSGYIVLLIMEITSAFGYGLFPLEGDKTIMTFQNMMHIIVTIIVVFTTIASCYLLAMGYKKQGLNKIGNFILLFAVIITISGSLNPINMSMNLGILGLTERLVIYSLQILIFSISYIYTFKEDKIR
jgi:hypothetical protein